MARIFAIHGIASRVDPALFAFRNLCDVGALRAFLSTASRFVPLADALAGRGNALTIDDATRAAADAALLARAHGHAVSVFVNPGQVISGAPHSFLLLNALLDSIETTSCDFGGKTFPTSTTGERQVLRREIKAALGAIGDEQARSSLVAGLATQWRAGALNVPPHFATLARKDLIGLRDAGVDVQNHGWSHANHQRLSAEDSAGEILAGQAWLHRELAVEAKYFAVPFGDAWPLPAAAAVCETWLTAMDEMPPGWLAPGVFNREPLTLPSSSEKVQPSG